MIALATESGLYSVAVRDQWLKWAIGGRSNSQQAVTRRGDSTSSSMPLTHLMDENDEDENGLGVENIDEFVPPAGRTILHNDNNRAVNETMKGTVI